MTPEGNLKVNLTAKVKIVASEVSAFINSVDGPVMRKFTQVGEEVKVATIESLKEGFPRDFLAPSIVKRIVPQADGPHMTVGSNRVVTRPHPIVGNPLLAFHWEKIGAFIVVRSVNHPGSDFTKYLLEKLMEAATAARVRTLL